MVVAQQAVAVLVAVVAHPVEVRRPVQPLPPRSSLFSSLCQFVKGKEVVCSEASPSAFMNARTAASFLPR